MVRLAMSFFTQDVIRAIRTKSYSHMAIWKTYRAFHHTNVERVSSQNAVFILREFQNVCETISSLPEKSVMSFLKIQERR